MKLILLLPLFLLLLFFYYHFSESINNFDMHSFFEDEIHSLKESIIKDISCPLTLKPCDSFSGALMTNIAVKNIWGGEKIASEGTQIGSWLVKAHCQKDSDNYRFVAISATRTNHYDQGQNNFSDAFDQGGIFFSDDQIFNNDLKLCKTNQRIKTDCPKTMVLRGFNDMGLPLCQNITASMFGPDEWSCPDDSILVGINIRGEQGDVIEKVRCLPTPPPQAPCPDCECEPSSSIELVASQLKGLYHDVSYDPPPPPGGDRFCQEATGSPEAILCPRCLSSTTSSSSGGMWAISQWPESAPKCHKKSIYESMNWWNPKVEAYYACKKGPSLNKFRTESVVKKKEGKCSCNGVPFKGGTSCN